MNCFNVFDHFLGLALKGLTNRKFPQIRCVCVCACVCVCVCVCVFVCLYFMLFSLLSSDLGG